MTPEEFDALTNFDVRYRYELVRGVLVVTPPPGPAERDPNGELEFLLREYKKRHPLGAALDKTLAEQEIQPGDNRRRPDRVIWAGLGRVPDPAVDVPTIAIEFVSPGKRSWLRDYQEKRPSTWRRRGRVLGHRPLPPHDDRLPQPAPAPAEQVVTENEIYRTDLLPGFELPLAQVRGGRRLEGAEEAAEVTPDRKEWIENR